MHLLNKELVYELVYDPEDTPKEFSFVDWPYLVPVLKAVTPKILEVEQRGIYGDQPRSFAVQVSGSASGFLTEQEQVDILTAWTNFDAAPEKVKEKKIATEELRISLGIKTKAYMGYLCELNNLTVEDYEFMLSDPTLTVLDRLLLNGALESSKVILDAYVPTFYFSSDFKNSLSSKLDEYITQVNVFIAS